MGNAHEGDGCIGVRHVVSSSCVRVDDELTVFQFAR